MLQRCNEGCELHLGFCGSVLLSGAGTSGAARGLNEHSVGGVPIPARSVEFQRPVQLQRFWEQRAIGAFASKS